MRKFIGLGAPMCTMVCTMVLVCTVTLAAVEEYGSEKAPQRVLLGYEKTAFKNALVKQLVGELQDEVFIRAVDHNRGELEDERAADYDAVIIINSGVNSRVRPWVTKWLNRVRDTEKVILLTTYRDLGWKPIYPEGVDSITSPSKKNRMDSMTETIVTKIRALLSQSFG